MPEIETKRTTPMPNHLQLGRLGEELAATWLARNGFRLLDRNWKSKNGYELDIVAFKGNALHVVEVKTRTSDELFNPLAAINHQKLLHLHRAAYCYKKTRRLDFDVYIDGIVIVYRGEGDYDLKYVPNLHQQMLHINYYQHTKH